MGGHTIFLNDSYKDYVVTSKMHVDFLKKTDLSCTSFLKKLLEDVFPAEKTPENCKDIQDSRYWS